MMQYATDVNLAARQRLWRISRREPDLDLFKWVIALVPEGRALDVGCGNGAYLAATGAIGMDLSLGMLASARARASNVLVGADAQAIPFASDTFDVVIAPHMLYHVPDIELAAREMRRVLRDGGVCVAVTNGETAQRSLKDLVEDVVGNGWRWMGPSTGRFTVENGAVQLGAGFDSVETVGTRRHVLRHRC